jgi:hypothetical protein
MGNSVGCLTLYAAVGHEIPAGRFDHGSQVLSEQRGLFHVRPPGDILLRWRAFTIESASQRAVDLPQIMAPQPVGQPESLGQ